MKKLVLVLLVAVLSVPAFAAPVIKLAKGAGADLGKVLVYVDANSGSLASGIGLTVTATGGNITGVTGFKTGVSEAATTKGYGIFPGQIVITNGAIQDPNTPVASGINTPVVALEFGALYKRSVLTDAPDPCSLLCKLTVASGVTKVTVAGDSLSCGTVGGVPAGIITEALGAFAVNAEISMDCLYVGRVFDRPGTPTTFAVTQAMVDAWVALGKPSCWCCAAQKMGNVVSTNTRTDNQDLAALKLSFGKSSTQVGYNPCADFNLSARVDNADLALLKLKFGATVGACVQ